MKHPAIIKPAEHAEWRADKMGKSTIYESPRLLVGLNGFEPGQCARRCMRTLAWTRCITCSTAKASSLLADSELPMRAGDLLMAPEGVPHGVKNTGPGRLLVLAVLAPSP